MKNKKLELEIQKLKNEYNIQYNIQINLNNELNSLKNNIQQLKIENENIKNENIKLKNQYNKINNINQINEINKLKQIIIEKDNEIKELKLQKIENKIQIDINDIMVINFESIDQSVRTGIKCLADNTFAEVEEKLYQKFDEFRNTNNIFFSKGNTILRFKKIKENNIKDGDTILFDKQ